MFVKKYGGITSKGNDRAFRDDADYPLLCSLENVDEEGKVTKADMFYKQTIKPDIRPENVVTAIEALNISINEFGSVNIPFMLSIYEPDISKKIKELEEQAGERVTLSEQARAEVKGAAICEELSGIIFLNPVLYNEEARIAVQAYIHFYDKNDEIEQLSQIPDLIERVDKVIEDRLNHLQEEDHNLLRSNLHELILEETGADYSSVWVEVIKY